MDGNDAPQQTEGRTDNDFRTVYDNRFIGTPTGSDAAARSGPKKKIRNSGTPAVVSASKDCDLLTIPGTVQPAGQNRRRQNPETGFPFPDATEGSLHNPVICLRMRSSMDFREP